MGKEWYWGGSKSSNSKRGGDRDTTHSTTSTTTPGCMSAVFQFFDFHHFQFPLHPQQSSFKPGNSFLPEDHSILKGVEAPRNSMELERTPLSPISLIKEEEEENLNIPMVIQIKTSCGHSRSKVGSSTSNDSSSETSFSPVSKTPNLVARLMGLDLLPESHSPSSSSCHEKSNLQHLPRLRQSLHGKQVGHRNFIDVDITGTLSLPETPRISSARRSDVDLHHRLSLQISKENVGVGEELDFSRFSSLRRIDLKQEDESRSPSHYARQIVKQVKESVSRKVGVDITNTLRNREQARDRDELVNPLKAKKRSSVLSKVVDQSSPGKHSTPSCSPKLSRFLESKQKPVTSTTSSEDNIPRQPRKSSPSSLPSEARLIHPQTIKVLSTKSKLQPVQEQEHHNHNHEQERPDKKCKKVAADEGFSKGLKKPPQKTGIIRNKQEETFVRHSTTNRVNSPEKKCKNTPLSSDLLNITVPTLLPVKKDLSPPATKLPQKQVFNAQSSKRNVQLFNNSVKKYKQEATQTLVVRENIDDRTNGVNTTTAEGGAEYEYEYVTRILRSTGIDKATTVSFTQWFSPAHPLDPSIFHHLETMNNPTISSHQLTHHCNRKLLFELVDEILVDILKPYIKKKPWIHVSGKNVIGRDYGQILQGSDLIDTLCMHIKSFPCADCRVLEDIDALIDKDLPQMIVQREMAFEEEGEGVVMEIEKEILDTLIQETAVEFGICH